jgi:hypothetical protein
VAAGRLIAIKILVPVVAMSWACGLEGTRFFDGRSVIPIRPRSFWAGMDFNPAGIK